MAEFRAEIATFAAACAASCDGIVDTVDSVGALVRLTRLTRFAVDPVGIRVGGAGAGTGLQDFERLL